MSKKLPSNLKVIRIALGFTQVKFADRLGFSYPYYLAVETGQRAVTDSVRTKVIIASGFDPITGLSVAVHVFIEDKVQRLRSELVGLFEKMHKNDH